MEYCALIPAAGCGMRMQQQLPKQYLPLHGYPLLWHTIASLTCHPKIVYVAVIVDPNDHHFIARDYVDIPAADKLDVYYCGGKTRAETVKNGLNAISEKVEDNSWVLVHDAARPCLTTTLLEHLISTVGQDRVGGVLGMPVSDTMKLSDKQRIQHTVPREGLWLVQTPQMFRYRLLCDALAQTHHVTDEASAIEMLGHSPLLVQSSHHNLKVTYPGDLQLAEAILQRRKSV